MWIFVDDSGDCGFKFAEGSSRHIVMAACIFRSRDSIAHALKCIELARTNTAPDGHTYLSCREFKYSKTKTSVKDRFFEAIQPAEFDVRAIVLDKQRIYSTHLLSNPNDLKSYLIRQMLTHTYGTVIDAKLVIDGKDTRAFGLSDRSYLMRMVNRDQPVRVLREVEFADSRANGLVQLADMIAGSLRESVEGDAAGRAHFMTYRERCRQPWGNIWQFGGRRRT